MQKSFSLLNRLFALCVCAFALSFFFACSDEKKEDPPTLEEICGSGISVGCLAGEWRFSKVEDAVNSDSAEASGTLNLDPDGGYRFEGQAEGKSYRDYYGTWSLTPDGKMHIESAEMDLNKDVTIEIASPWTTLRIHGSNGKAIFSDFQEGYSFPNPVEVFTK